MLHHVSIGMTDVERAAQFYDAVLAKLAFHVAALAAGGKDEGSPGPRPEYTAKYYGAFVRDLDGNKIEALFLPIEPAKPAKKAAARKSASKKSAKPKAKLRARRGVRKR